MRPVLEEHVWCQANSRQAELSKRAPASRLTQAQDSEKLPPTMRSSLPPGRPANKPPLVVLPNRFCVELAWRTTRLSDRRPAARDGARGRRPNHPRLANGKRGGGSLEQKVMRFIHTNETPWFADVRPGPLGYLH